MWNFITAKQDGWVGEDGVTKHVAKRMVFLVEPKRRSVGDLGILDDLDALFVRTENDKSNRLGAFVIFATLPYELRN